MGIFVDLKNMNLSFKMQTNEIVIGSFMCRAAAVVNTVKTEFMRICG